MATLAHAVPEKEAALGAALEVKGYEPDLEWTAAEERMIRRRIDLLVLPFLMILFVGLQLDRNNVGNALTDALAANIGATLDDVNRAQTLFTLGFVVFEIPMAFIARRFGPHRALPIWCLGWSICTISQGFVNTPAQLMGTRFLIGMFEAGYIPQAAYYLSRFYTRKELGFRFILLWQSNSFASVLAGALSTGILTLRGTNGHAGWQYLFWIEGTITAIFAITALLVLPRGAAYTAGGIRGKGWLNERQAAIAVTRVLKDDPTKADDSKLRHLSRADVFVTLKNWRIAIHCVIAFLGGLCLYALGTYTPTLIKTIGPFKTGYAANAAAIPGYVASAIFSLCIAWNSDRTQERGLHVAFGLLVTAVGLFWLALPPNDVAPGVLYAGVLFSNMGAGSTLNGLQAAWIAGQIPSKQRPIAFAALLMFVNATGFVSTNIFPSSAAPRYVWPLCVCAGTSVAAAIIAIVLKFIYKRFPYVENAENKPVTRGESTHSSGSDSIKGAADDEKSPEFLAAAAAPVISFKA